jgi:hypothetical protein
MVGRHPVAGGGHDRDRRRLWVNDPNHVFFNLNGHTYYCREDWLKVWDHSRPRFSQTGSCSTGDLVIWINGDLALLTADQVDRYKEWIGQEPGDSLRHYRATMVFVRKPGDERHPAAEAARGDRPGPPQVGSSVGTGADR